MKPPTSTRHAAILVPVVVLALNCLAGPSEAQSPPFEPASEQAQQSLNETSAAAQQDRRRALSAIDTRAERSRFRGVHISLSLKEADLTEVLRSFARLADVNLVIDDAVAGKVTVELHDVPWDQALYVILKSQGVSAELDGRVWRVAR